MKRRLVTLVGFLLVMAAGQALASTQLPQLRVLCSWMPPQIGSLPVHYELQVRIVEDPAGWQRQYLVAHVGGPGDLLAQTFVFQDGSHGYRYQARVRGVDAWGRTGPWSTWNEPQDWVLPPEF